LISHRAPNESRLAEEPLPSLLTEELLPSLIAEEPESLLGSELESLLAEDLESELESELLPSLLAKDLSTLRTLTLTSTRKDPSSIFASDTPRNRTVCWNACTAAAALFADRNEGKQTISTNALPARL
jgi:hypothetical protein